MSKIAPTIVSCPRCGAEQEVPLFDSLNGDRVPVQVEALRQGRFERVDCAGCGHPFQPEHRMLFAHFTARIWIAMCPRVDRPRFATLERGIELVMADAFAGAPPVVADGVRGVRPRLVFGQHMLAEAVRVADAGLEPALLECAKLFAVRRDLQRLMRTGPFELCFERFADTGELVLGLHLLASGERLDAVELPGDALAETHAARDELNRMYPELFERPYVSACRYLYGAAG